MPSWRVIEAYRRSRENPVAGEVGDVLRTGRTDDWAGHRWIWCTDERGREGWVAEAVLDRRGETAVLRRDFDAVELSVSESDVVTGDRTLSGWLWAMGREGTAGWVPLEVVEQL